MIGFLVIATLQLGLGYGAYLFFDIKLTMLASNSRVPHYLFSTVFAVCTGMFLSVISHILGSFGYDDNLFTLQLNMILALLLLLIVIPSYQIYSLIPYWIGIKQQAALFCGLLVLFLYAFWQVGNPFPELQQEYGT